MWWSKGAAPPTGSPTSDSRGTTPRWTCFKPSPSAVSKVRANGFNNAVHRMCGSLLCDPFVCNISILRRTAATLRYTGTAASVRPPCIESILTFTERSSEKLCSYAVQVIMRFTCRTPMRCQSKARHWGPGTMQHSTLSPTLQLSR